MLEDDGNDHFDVRITDLALLHSAYPGQLDLDDGAIRSAIEEQNYSLVVSKAISGSLTLQHSKLEVYFVLEAEKKPPLVHCRVIDGSLDKRLQRTINDYVNGLGGGDLISIVQSIDQHWQHIDQNEFRPNRGKTAETTNNSIDNDLSRLWIYSHHIYSATKRKHILDLSSTLTGFMLIGKPGFICLEGQFTDCDQVWSTIRSWNWQRISLIETERSVSERCFSGFSESTDRSSIFKILQSKNCDTILRQFLGFK